MPTIFISHTWADAPLALKLKEFLAASLTPVIPALKIFCSSDVGDIEGGKKWFDQVMENLKRATACVALMTPQSIYFSHWVTYEAGGAYLRFEMNSKKSRLFPVCGHGVTGGILPSPFNELQVRQLSNPKEIVTLCKELAISLGASPPRQPRRLLGDLATEAAKGSRFWSSVSSTLVGQRLESSPFSLESLLPGTVSTVFCAGFNLHHIATTPRLKKALFQFLSSPQKTVRLLVSDPRAQKDFRAWSLVGKAYLDDLNESVRTFRTWLSEARRLRLKGTLEIKRAPFVTLSVMSVDHDTADGQLVITPTISGKPLSAERPHFWLSKRRHPKVFDYYWDTYEDLFKRSAPL
jgi:hypothetical protein